MQEGTTLLNEAIYKGERKTVRGLLDEGEDVDSKDKMGVRAHYYLLWTLWIAVF